MAGTGTIKISDIGEMVEIVARLTRESIGFEVRKESGDWIIEMTGAY